MSRQVRVRIKASRPSNRRLFNVMAKLEALRTQPKFELKRTETKCLCAKLGTWNHRQPGPGSIEHLHHAFWWGQHAGMPLATLLHCADYSPEMQHHHLAFFAQVVAPSLGVSRSMPASQDRPWWPSFMTDDGTPIELSWDWGSGNGPPTIRYSVEPIGLKAGTFIDPANLSVGHVFQEQMLQHLPTTRLEWFQHFSEFFNGCPNDEQTGYFSDPKDHSSSIFYAFDLARSKDMTAKAYFFPKMRARQRNQSKLEVMFEAMYAAPEVRNKDGMKAGAVFGDFCSDPCNNSLEHEMLAIDLIDPSESRIKLYFRTRETTFASVINTMTLGGRIDNPAMRQGLHSLRNLWNAVLGFAGEGGAAQADSEPLPVDRSHRTSGILYNVEFRASDEYPVAKIYIPVRHYALSDEAVVHGLCAYFDHDQGGQSSLPRYREAMNMLFCPEVMKAGRGIQTYLGCAIRPDGTLRLVSYMKPDLPKVR